MASTPSSFQQRATEARAYVERTCLPISGAATSLEEIGRSLEGGHLVIFAASGISLFDPSCMPSGAVFSAGLLSVLESAHTLPITVPSNASHDFLARVPFEVVLHFGRIAVGREPLLRLLDNFFSKTTINSVHTAVANLLLRSNPLTALVTPNYDILIEEAARIRLGAFTIDEALQARGVYRVCEPADFRGVAAGGPILFKIHGSIDVAKRNPDCLVFELPQESTLPDWKADVLAELLTGKDVLFVGYGGWDFDMLPALTQIAVGRVWWNCYKDPQASPHELPDEACTFIASTRGSVLFGDLRDLLSNLPGVSVEKRDGCDPSKTVREELASAFDGDDLRLWYGTLLARVGFGAEARTVLASLGGAKDELARKVEREIGHAAFHMGQYATSFRHYRTAAAHLERLEGVSTDVLNIWCEAIEALIQQHRWIAASHLLAKSFVALRHQSGAPEAELRHRRGLLYRLLAKHPILLRSAWRDRLNDRASQLLKSTEPIAAAMAARSLLQTGRIIRSDSSMVDFANVRMRFRRLGHAIAEINGYRDEGKTLFREWLAERDPKKLNAARTAFGISLQLANERRDAPGVAKALHELGKVAEARREYRVAAKNYRMSRHEFSKLEDGPLQSVQRWIQSVWRECACHVRSLLPH